MTEPETQTVVRKGEYARKGEFHRDLDPNWSYYPVYINKLEVVHGFVEKYCTREMRLLDAGCGEGVLVEKYRALGYQIEGFDKNYQSEYVCEGSMTDIPFGTDSQDAVFCLDVLEHLPLMEQIKALNELRRVVKPGGLIVFSLPNLAHFASRIKFLLRGRFLRTATVSHHPGDRPAVEYAQLFRDYEFDILETKGIFPTVPFIYPFVRKHPAKSAGLLRLLRKLPFPAYWNFQVLFVCRVS